MKNRALLRSAAGTALLFTACTPEQPRDESEAQPNGPVGVTVLDSIRLQDTDTAFVAQPAAIAVTAQGDLFLSDNANKRIYRFRRDGRFVRTISKRGSGPGEVESVGSIALDGDSLLVVKNLARLRVEVFAAASGEFRWGRQLPQRTFDITASNGTIYAGGLLPNASTSLASFSSATDSVRHLGWVPELLRDHPILIGPFGTVAHHVAGDAIAQAFEASDYIYFRTSPLVRDSIFLPRIRRRGAATEALRATAADTSRGREALFRSSIPMLTRFVNDSIIAVVHSDVELSNNLFTGRYFLSLLDVRTRRVCIDLPLALPSDPLPRITMVADTLVAVVQHVPDAGDAGTFVVRMHVSVNTCPWNYVARQE